MIMNNMWFWIAAGLPLAGVASVCIACFRPYWLEGSIRLASYLFVSGVIIAIIAIAL